MTTVYKDYYAAYDNGTLDLSKVSFLVMLCDETYFPIDTDHIDNVQGEIIAVPYVIQNDDMQIKGMSELMEQASEIVKDYMELYPSEVRDMKKFEDGRFVVVYDPSLDILCFC